MVCEDYGQVTQQIMSLFAYCIGDGMKFPDMRGGALKTRAKSLAIRHDWM